MSERLFLGLLVKYLYTAILVILFFCIYILYFVCKSCDPGDLRLDSSNIAEVVLCCETRGLTPIKLNFLH